MYAEMLQEEVDRSKKFTEENFGLMVGDEFPEMVKELASVDGVCGALVATYAMSFLHTKSLLMEFKETAKTPDGSVDWLRVIRGNMATFELPLSLFYWGVQVGRRLQSAEQNAWKGVKEER